MIQLDNQQAAQLPAGIERLNSEQVVRLAERIVQWMLSDDSLLWNVAVKQAQGWTLGEYRELLEEEEHGEQV